MTQRLTKRYKVGDRVEIRFSTDTDWLPGQVVRLDAPAVWVQTTDGRQWFVTNTRRIRPLMSHE